MITIQSNREPARIQGAGTGRKHDFSDIGFTDQRLSDHHRADGSRPFGGLPAGVVFFGCNGAAAGGDRRSGACIDLVRSDRT